MYQLTTRKNRNSEIKTYLRDKQSRYKKKSPNDVELIFYDNRIYVPSSLHWWALEWYPGDRLANTLVQVCYWKGLMSQAKNFTKHCDVCQKFKRKNKRYGKLPPKEIAIMQLWYMVHIDLIGPYTITQLNNMRLVAR